MTECAGHMPRREVEPQEPSAPKIDRLEGTRHEGTTVACQLTGPPPPIWWDGQPAEQIATCPPYRFSPLEPENA
jgi:hypothetical protein